MTNPLEPILRLPDFALPIPTDVVLAGARFTRYDYDGGADVLYLRVGEYRPAAVWDGAEEGHGIVYDAEGSLRRLTLLNPRWYLDTDGAVPVTVTEGGPTTWLSREAIEPLLVDTPVPADFVVPEPPGD